jgi:hypothetical protein
MRHPPAEALVAHLDGEISGPSASRVARHVAACVACRGRLAEMRDSTSSVAAVLARIDDLETTAASGFPGVHAHPASAVPAVNGRAGTTRPAGTRTHARTWRWAAAFVLVAGGATAALLTESADTQRARPEATAAVQEPASPLGGLIHVAPAHGVLDIALTGVAPGTRIEIAFADAADVVIEADGVAGPHFRAARGDVALDLAETPVRVRIVYPHDLHSGAVRVDGVTVARVGAGRVVPFRRIEGVTVVGPRTP